MVPTTCAVCNLPVEVGPSRIFPADARIIKTKVCFPRSFPPPFYFDSSIILKAYCSLSCICTELMCHVGDILTARGLIEVNSNMAQFQNLTHDRSWSFVVGWLACCVCSPDVCIYALESAYSEIKVRLKSSRLLNASVSGSSSAPMTAFHLHDRHRTVVVVIFIKALKPTPINVLHSN